MNRAQRKALAGIIERLEGIAEEISDIYSEEQGKLDNMDNFQGTERYEQMEAGVGMLEDAQSGLEDIIANLSEL